MKNVFYIFVFLLVSTFGYSQAEINQLDAQGNKHGLWKGTYSESKRPRYEGTFDHGKETGIFKYFDDTKAGTVIATREFNAKDNSAYTIFYDQKNNKVSEGRVVNKQYEGEWKYYHLATTVIMTLENYKNGKLQGKRSVFYPDGKIAEEAHYANGLREGAYKKYAQNGTVLEEETFVKGVQEGPATYRNGDGSLASKGNYAKGGKKGTWEFYENNKLRKKEKYPLKRKFEKVSQQKIDKVMGK